MSGQAKTNVYQQVLAQLLIFLVIAGSVAALVFLTTRALSCVHSISASPPVSSQPAYDSVPDTLVVGLK